PAAGPNYYTFSQSARYNIYLDRNGDGRPDVTYTFRFKTPTGPYFLGNTQQSWTATRNGKFFAKGQTPIDNIGPRFNGFVGVKDYEAAAEKTIVQAGGVSIFAGQRDDPFYADVGAIFDLVAIRKAGTTGNLGGGKDFLSGYDVHTIALQIPVSQVGIPETGRDDLVAVLGTGIPKLTYTGKTFADELRLNLSIAPSAHPNRMGVLGGDTAGFPNGRRLGDDIVDIEEQAVAGFLKGKKVPLGDGVNADSDGYLSHFPYVMTPHQGYANEKATS